MKVYNLNEITDSKILYDRRPPAFMKYILLLVVALIIAGVIWASKSVKTYIVKGQGIVVSENKSHIMTKGSGEIKEVFIQEGSEVKEGDVLTLLNGLDGYKEDRIFITTSFGLVIGELSSREGEIIRNLIMAGERIAGKIEKYDDNIDFMYISLYKKGDYLIKELSNIINEKFKFLIED